MSESRGNNRHKPNYECHAFAKAEDSQFKQIHLTQTKQPFQTNVQRPTECRRCAQLFGTEQFYNRLLPEESIITPQQQLPAADAIALAHK
jgi:hypothetical protein